MKNLKLATIILFITAGTFIFSPARAVTPWQPISGGSGNSDGGQRLRKRKQLANRRTGLVLNCSGVSHWLQGYCEQN